MSSTERTPLIPSHNGDSLHNGDGQRRPFVHRVLDAIKGDNDDPSWLASYRFYLFGSWFNVLLVFIPLSFLSHWLHWDAALRFSFSFIAIMPLAKLLGEATDQLSMKLGDTLSGLLNASFGNAVEIIVGIAALLQGELRSLKYLSIY
jgi:Ca2+:H+ antiporter